MPAWSRSDKPDPGRAFPAKLDDAGAFQDYGDVVRSLPLDAAGEWDYVVIGAGCTGSIAARKILERQPGARLLLLEQGPFLLPDHVQNLQSLYQPLMSAATASPWLSDGDLEIVAQIPYLGGRTLFWSGSSP